MKKLILIIAIVFSGMLMQAQSLRQVANESLHKSSKSYSRIMDSDYGKVLFKFHTKHNEIIKVRVTAIIGSDIYLKIKKRNDYQYVKYGEFRVDFYFMSTTSADETLPEQ